MIWYFIGVYIINRTLHGHLEIQNFSSSVEKYFTRSLRSLMKYFSTLKENFCISARSGNILYVVMSTYQDNIKARSITQSSIQQITVGHLANYG